MKMAINRVFGKPNFKHAAAQVVSMISTDFEPLRRIQMQKYECHKTVEAMKIHKVDTLADGSVTLVAKDSGAFNVTKEWFERHEPQIGGYLVRYQDGYTSYSPAQAFEDGYTLSDEAPERVGGTA